MDELFRTTEDTQLLRQTLEILDANACILVLVTTDLHIVSLTSAAKSLLQQGVLSHLGQLLSTRARSSLRLCMQLGTDTAFQESLDGKTYEVQAKRCGANYLLYFCPADAIEPALTLETFLAGRMRQSLSTILTANNLLMKNPAPDKREQCHAVIHASTLRMQRLLAHTGFLLKPTLDSPPNLYLQDAAALCREIAAKCSAACGGKIEVLAKVPESCSLVFDKPLISQALYNLMTNALTAPGVKTITLGLTEQEDGVLFHVIDDGQGIAPEALPRLYDGWKSKTPQSFETIISESASRLNWGLGLPLCRQIASMHGGALLMQPAEPQGTAFTLAVPKNLLTLYTLGQPALENTNGFDIAELELSVLSVLQ